MKTVAFIGLGVMGKLMAANLAKKYKVRSYDLNGSGNCRTARAAAEGSEVLITMVPNGNDPRKLIMQPAKKTRKNFFIIIFLAPRYQKGDCTAGNGSRHICMR